LATVFGEITSRSAISLFGESPRDQAEDHDLARRQVRRALAGPRDAVASGAEHGLDGVGLVAARLDGCERLDSQLPDTATGAARRRGELHRADGDRRVGGPSRPDANRPLTELVVTPG
jgi:hypothetical protein